jgi:hypothetical protein
MQPVPEAASPEAVTRLVLADIARVGPLLRATGLRPEQGHPRPGAMAMIPAGRRALIQGIRFLSWKALP